MVRLNLFKSALRKRIERRITDLSNEIAELKIDQARYPYIRYPKEYFSFETKIDERNRILKELITLIK